MFKTIIWATDGSEAADRALPYAKAFAGDGDRTLVVVHVKELLVGRGGGNPVYADADELVGKVKDQVAELRKEGFEVTLSFGTGTTASPAHLIADVALETGGDVIVVGTRGRGPIAGLLLGSVTQRLLHIAHCPVFAVPPLEPAEISEPVRGAVGAAY